MPNYENDATAWVSPQDARQKVLRGEAVLVCAYEDEQKCATNRLTDGVTLDEVRQDDARQWIFYCG